jgi:phosphoenolpyruvate synthase/pyruvate phosphate dikinase
MRLLVIAAEPVEAGQLADVVGEDLEDAEIRVVTPALNDSRLAFWVSDPDEAIAEAESTTEESVSGLRAEGIDAEGETGESDPCSRSRTPWPRSPRTAS